MGIATRSELAQYAVSDQLLHATREALVEILSVGASTWGKVELAGWLRHSYAPAVDGSPESGVVRSEQARERRPTEERLHEVLRGARRRALEAAEAALEGDVSFAMDALAAGHVVGTVDAQGAYRFLPVDAEHMRLIERILSLLAADVLSNPMDYEQFACVCSVCGSFTFNPGARQRGRCDSHPTSGIVPRATPGRRFETIRAGWSCDPDGNPEE
jgi:hypothetical protein